MVTLVCVSVVSSVCRRTCKNYCHLAERIQANESRSGLHDNDEREDHDKCATMGSFSIGYSARMDGRE